MNILETIDYTLAGPARKMADYASKRKQGADMALAREFAILGNGAVAVSSIILGYYFFAVLAVVLTLIHLKNTGSYALAPVNNGIGQFLRIVILVFGISAMVNGLLSINAILTLMGAGFVMQTIGDQIASYRGING